MERDGRAGTEMSKKKQPAWHADIRPPAPAARRSFLPTLVEAGTALQPSHSVCDLVVLPDLEADDWPATRRAVYRGEHAVTWAFPLRVDAHLLRFRPGWQAPRILPVLLAGYAFQRFIQSAPASFATPRECTRWPVVDPSQGSCAAPKPDFPSRIAVACGATGCGTATTKCQPLKPKTSLDVPGVSVQSDSHVQ